MLIFAFVDCWCCLRCFAFCKTKTHLFLKYAKRWAFCILQLCVCNMVGVLHFAICNVFVLENVRLLNFCFWPSCALGRWMALIICFCWFFRFAICTFAFIWFCQGERVSPFSLKTCFAKCYLLCFTESGTMCVWHSLVRAAILLRWCGYCNLRIAFDLQVLFSEFSVARPGGRGFPMCNHEVFLHFRNCISSISHISVCVLCQLSDSELVFLQEIW